MRHRNGLRGLAIIAAATIGVVTGCGQGSQGEGTDGDDVVKVGLSAAFSGKTAYYGQDSKQGIELAIDRLKQTMPDVTFTLVTADDECTPQGGAAAFRQLAGAEQVDVILGSPCSPATLGGMPTLPRSKVPAMTFGATNPKITEQAGVGGNPYMWRMNINDQIIGEQWSGYIADAGFEQAAIIAANNDYGRGAAGVYAKLLPEHGVELVATEYYNLGASDFRPQLTKIESAGADVLIPFTEPPDCAQMVRQMHEMGMDTPIYGRGCATAEGLQAVGDPTLMNGLHEASYWAPTDSQQEMLDAFTAKHDEDIPPYNTALAYYGMLTIAEAVKAGGTDRAGIQEGLGKVNFETGIGPITFDDHNQAHPNMFILEIQDGKIEVLDTIDTGK